MKRARGILVLLLTLAVLSACAHSLGRILQKEELVVGTAGSMPPMNMTTKDGEIIGLEVDLARKMAASMGVSLRIETMPFAELLPALEAGKVDMVMSSMTITPRRNLRVAFVGPYFISGKAFLTKIDKIAAAKEGAEVNRPGVTLAALKDSTSQFFVETVIPKAKLVTTAHYDEAVKMVIEDKVDALVADYPICVISVFRHPGKGLASVVTTLTYEPLGIAMPADDPHLINWVENFLKGLEGSGQLEALKDRWFGDASWLKRLPE